MTDQELQNFAEANKTEFLRLNQSHVDLRWLWIYLIGIVVGALAFGILTKGLL